MRYAWILNSISENVANLLCDILNFFLIRELVRGYLSILWAIKLMLTNWFKLCLSINLTQLKDLRELIARPCFCLLIPHYS